jgi:hypothetical protein
VGTIEMIAKVQKEYTLKMGSSMDIDESELDKIAAQLENVINTNFPHIRVHIEEPKDEDTSESSE